MNNKIEKIHVELLEEGISVHRPVRALSIGDELYCILLADFDPDVEAWRFPPGAVVRTELRKGERYAIEEIAISELSS